MQIFVLSILLSSIQVLSAQEDSTVTSNDVIQTSTSTSYLALAPFYSSMLRSVSLANEAARLARMTAVTPFLHSILPTGTAALQGVLERIRRWNETHVTSQGMPRHMQHRSESPHPYRRPHHHHKPEPEAEPTICSDHEPECFDLGRCIVSFSESPSDCHTPVSTPCYTYPTTPRLHGEAPSDEDCGGHNHCRHSHPSHSSHCPHSTLSLDRSSTKNASHSHYASTVTASFTSPSAKDSSENSAEIKSTNWFIPKLFLALMALLAV